MDVIPHPHEADRLLSVESYQGLVADADVAPRQIFDALSRLAASICHTPVSVISLIDDHRQQFLGRFGIGGTEQPRAQSASSDAVATGLPLIIPDMSRVPRYAALDDVAGPDGFKGFAAVPLMGRDGLPLGILSVLDTEPRVFRADQLSALADLARQAVIVLELRRRDFANGMTATNLVAEAREPLTLRNALDNHEFVPYFEPFVDLRDGRICGLETLVRWRHPTRGLLVPEAFLAGLETGTLVEAIGQEMLEGTCRILVDLRATGIELPDGVAINVSGAQLTRPGLAGRILDTLARHALPGRLLAVEVTEAAEVGDIATAISELAILRAAGIGVVADDFGVGWSNLVRLLHLPLTGLKIDKELATGMIGDRFRDHMVASTITLARTMGLQVIAEGVETEPVRERLIELGCDRGQGWLFSKAVPAAELPALLNRTFPRIPPAAATTQAQDQAARTDADRTNADRTDDHCTNAQLPDDTGFADALLDALPDSTAVLDRTGKIIAVNRSWRMFSLDNGGSPESTGVGVNYLDVCKKSAAHGSADAIDVVHGLQSVLAGETVESECEYPCPSPAVGRWFTSRITPITGPSGGALVSHVNITRRKQSEQQLLHQASHDPLTGLANRKLFVRQLTTALSPRPGRSPVPDVGVFYLDLDHFKPVNDNYGHSAGDEVLLEVAHRLRANVRPQDTVARLGGDEFAICAPRITAAVLDAMTARLRRSLARNHLIHGSSVYIPASIGAHLACAGDDPLAAADLADKGMYADKRMYADKARTATCTDATTSISGPGEPPPSSDAAAL